MLHRRRLARLRRIWILTTACLVAIVAQFRRPSCAKRISKEAFYFVSYFAIGDSEKTKWLTV
jgi:hypothetical protein